MGIGKEGWIVLGVPFLCSHLPADLQVDLSLLLQGFPRLAPGEAAGGAVECRVEGYDGAGALLLGPGGESWNLRAEVASLSSQIEYRIVNEAIARARDRYVLHAGAVEDPRGTCLVIGESGAGKTSLTLWLWASGYRLATDDLCPIVHGSLLPEVFPRALHMDAEYSPRLLERIPPRPAAYPADYYPFPARPRDLPPVTRLLVLQRGTRPEGEVEPLSQSEAAHHLLAAVIKTPSFEFGEALRDMVRLATGCQAWRLRSSTPEGAGERALELLAS